MLSFDFNGIFNQGWTDGTSMGGSLRGKEFLSPSVPVWDFIIETTFLGAKDDKKEFIEKPQQCGGQPARVRIFMRLLIM